MCCKIFKKGFCRLSLKSLLRDSPLDVLGSLRKTPLGSLSRPRSHMRRIGLNPATNEPTNPYIQSNVRFLQKCMFIFLLEINFKNRQFRIAHECTFIQWWIKLWDHMWNWKFLTLLKKDILNSIYNTKT